MCWVLGAMAGEPCAPRDTESREGTGIPTDADRQLPTGLGDSIDSQAAKLLQSVGGRGRLWPCTEVTVLNSPLMKMSVNQGQIYDTNILTEHCLFNMAMF